MKDVRVWFLLAIALMAVGCNDQGPSAGRQTQQAPPMIEDSVPVTSAAFILLGCVNGATGEESLVIQYFGKTVNDFGQVVYRYDLCYGPHVKNTGNVDLSNAGLIATVWIDGAEFYAVHYQGGNDPLRPNSFDVWNLRSDQIQRWFYASAPLSSGSYPVHFRLRLGELELDAQDRTAQTSW